jgi:phytoene dehydrogenase-like protein
MERLMVSAVRGTVTHGAVLLIRWDRSVLSGTGAVPRTGPERLSVGSHSGGSITMAPGRNAAQIILRI